MAATSLLDKLRKGDRRSIGRADAVAREVLRRPNRLPELLAGLRHADPLIRMRAGDALEKVSRQEPRWFWPVRCELLDLAGTTKEQEARWHLAQTLPRLGFRGTQRAALVSVLRHYLKDPSTIVRVSALQALWELASGDPVLKGSVRRQLRRALKQGTAAERARARKLLAASAA